MAHRFDKLFASAASTGLMLGAVACSSSGGQPAASPGASPGKAASEALAEAKACCKAMNECKGKGNCAVPDKNDCAGKNECKGQGGCNAHCPK
jgi:hypothetical protein